MIIEDTIIAIATPIGHSLQAIVRLSGPEAIRLVRKVFKPKSFFDYSYRSIRGNIVLRLPELKLPVTLYIMKAPASYTREDVVEIHTLGVPPLLDILLNYFIRKGIRLATPGEFTHRAFLNGRIDLTQAESVLNIIKARNERDFTLATRQLTGHLSKRINQIRNDLKELLTRLELSLDFSDQDITIIPEAEIKKRLSRLIKEISNLLKHKASTAVFKEGISLVLCGRPNVGKSSLFNRLVKAHRSIVTPIAGTTRDVIESDFSLDGHRLRLFDTAGFGKIKPALSAIGRACPTVRRVAAQKTEEFLDNADMFLMVIDGSEPLTREDLSIFRKLPPDRTLVLINKSDLRQKIIRRQLKKNLNQRGVICHTSAQTGEGLDELQRHLVEILSQMSVDKSTSTQIINARYRESLASALDKLKDVAEPFSAEGGSASGGRFPPPELIAFEVREALDELGNITGATTPDDILNQIFSQFCVGK